MANQFHSDQQMFKQPAAKNRGVEKDRERRTRTEVEINDVEIIGGRVYINGIEIKGLKAVTYKMDAEVNPMMAEVTMTFYADVSLKEKEDKAEIEYRYLGMRKGQDATIDLPKEEQDKILEQIANNIADTTGLSRSSLAGSAD